MISAFGASEIVRNEIDLIALNSQNFYFFQIHLPQSENFGTRKLVGQKKVN